MVEGANELSAKPPLPQLRSSRSMTATPSRLTTPRISSVAVRVVASDDCVDVRVLFAVSVLCERGLGGLSKKSFADDTSPDGI
eukprot:2657123-Rhodomonas_salina.11